MIVGTTVGSDRQRIERPADRDEIWRHNDLRNEPLSKALPGCGVFGAQLVEDDFAEPAYRLWGEAPACRRKLPLDQQDFLLEVHAARALARRAVKSASRADTTGLTGTSWTTINIFRLPRNQYVKSAKSLFGCTE